MMLIIDEMEIVYNNYIVTKFNFSSRYKPRCFLWLVCATGMASKVKGIWLALSVFLEKTNS